SPAPAGVQVARQSRFNLRGPQGRAAPSPPPVGVQVARQSRFNLRGPQGRAVPSPPPAGVQVARQSRFNLRGCEASAFHGATLPSAQTNGSMFGSPSITPPWLRA